MKKRNKRGSKESLKSMQGWQAHQIFLQGYPQRIRLYISLNLTITRFNLVFCLKFGKARKKFMVAENKDFKKTDSIHSVRSSWKYHPFWITLYFTVLLLYCRFKKFFCLALALLMFNVHESKRPKHCFLFFLI